MVVVQILPELNNGGVERGTVEVANYLAEQGVCSIVISAGGRMLYQLHKEVEHFTLSVGKKSLTSLLLIRKLRQFFIQKKVDIVHARSRLPAWLAYQAIARIKNRKPRFVTTVHGLYSVKKYSSIMARADRVITVSQTAHDYIKNNYSSHLHQEPVTIYRGVDPKAFPYALTPEDDWLQQFYQKYPILENSKIVLLPGRLTEIKGVRELELWLKQVPAQSKLVLTADPSKDKYAQRLELWFREIGVNESVVWIGLQSSMPPLYAVADVVLNVSIRPESFGRTVVESLSIGTPVVGYDHGGVGEILNAIFPSGKVRLGDQGQLSRSINEVLKNVPQVENKQVFLLENMLQQTLALYRELINEA